ncbi:MAG: hypothetical protein H6632_17285 [Anaerolineales bacterium]|nr:hypothetical protein [Anaerolineales bacterium]
MKDIFTRLSLIIIVLLTVVNPWSVSNVSAQQNQWPVVTQSDEAGLSLTWQPPDYTLTTISVDGQTYSQPSIPGLTASGHPGDPELPIYSELVGLPPTGQVRLEIIEVERDVVPLPASPRPALSPQPVDVSPTDIDPHRLVGGGSMIRVVNDSIYTSDAFSPQAVAMLGEPMLVRDRRVAALTIFPLRVNPVSQEMEVVRLIRLRVTFSEPANAVLDLSSQQANQDRFTTAIGRTLLNPEAVQWTPARIELDAEQKQPSMDTLAINSLTKIYVDQPGLYALTYTDLQNIGWPLNILDPHRLKLSYGYPRQEVAILVEGESDGHFDPSDRILFYADPKFSRYVNYDVYFLSYSETNGRRMSSRSGSPTGLVGGVAWRTASAELNKFYDPLYAGHDGDYWYWAKLAQPSATSGSYAIQLTNVAGSGPNAQLQLWLQGYTAHAAINPDHRVSVKVNGTAIGAVEWDGKSAYTANLAAPLSVLQSGNNQIQLSLPGITGVFAEGAWLDSISMTYPTTQVSTGQFHFDGEAGQKHYTLSGASSSYSVYDITDPDAPQLVTGFSFSGGTLVIGDNSTTLHSYLVVPAGQIKSPTQFQAANLLVDPENGADYIIVTHPDFSEAIAPLVAYRSNQGLRVVTINVNAIYDTFGGGRMDAEAIRNFLIHAYYNWPAPKPSYVLLVGDGSYDFKNYSGYNAPTFVPPYLAPVDPWWGETASDNRLVTVAGSDTLPDLLIGRLPVASAAEVTTIVNKIIQYETNPPAGLWPTNHIFVADNPDGAGDFHQVADEALTDLPASFNRHRYYYTEGNRSQPYFYTNPESLNADLVTDFTSGASFISFYGHSSWEQWAVESFLALDDLGQLQNQNRLPIVSEMTCFTGFFHHPKEATFDESLLRRSGGGAVAVWGSTGLGVGAGHDRLQAGFYQTILQNGGPDLGTAILAGKLNLAALGYHQDLLDTFTLFGDPALRLSTVFKPDLRIAYRVQGSGHKPGDPVTFILTVENTGAGVATGIVVTNTVPPEILSPTWSTSTPGVTVSGTYTWTLPDLNPNQPVVIQVSGVIDPTLPDTFAIVNIATVSSGVSELSNANNRSAVIVGGYRLFLPLAAKAFYYR